jgi:hypothetical protein
MDAIRDVDGVVKALRALRGFAAFRDALSGQGVGVGHVGGVHGSLLAFLLAGVARERGVRRSCSSFRRVATPMKSVSTSKRSARRPFDFFPGAMRRNSSAARPSPRGAGVRRGSRSFRCRCASILCRMTRRSANASFR